MVETHMKKPSFQSAGDPYNAKNGMSAHAVFSVPVHFFHRFDAGQSMSAENHAAGVSASAPVLR